MREGARKLRNKNRKLTIKRKKICTKKCKLQTSIKIVKKRCFDEICKLGIKLKKSLQRQINRWSDITFSIETMEKEKGNYKL